MKKKPTKQTASTPKYDPQRETRVLLEEISQSVKTIAEQYGSIVKKLEEHDARFDRIESELKSIKMALMEVDNKTNKLDTRFSMVETSTERIEKKFDTTISQNEERFKRIEEKLEIT